MKTKLLTFIATIAMSVLVFATVADPIADFKTGLTIPTGDKILKWICDVNGDGKNEVLLCLKSDFDKDAQDHEPPGWSFYIADATGGTYTKSTGTAEQPDSLSVDDMPLIDPEACFIGQITQLSKRGIVTIQTDHPRKGNDVAYIYAYMVENDHLKRTLLAQYDPAHKNAVYEQYLKDSKRTHVTLQEVTP